MTRLVLVRHGRTEWNRVERYRGRADIDLDEVGRRQAEAVARRVTEWQVAAVYSSPLRRALFTAEIVARQLGLGVSVLPGLVDIDYGEWQGLTPDEAAARYDGLYSSWLKSPQAVKFPGGEGLAEVRDRASQAVHEVVGKHPRETVVMVSHKVVCQTLILSLLGLDNSHFWQIGQDNCAVNVFEVRDSTPSALVINDTCHLRGLETPPA